ncbi:MAG: tRNA-dihydrouridine synthase, partial [Christensenellales bacterium]|nr:tRNA-dihydrouridine synthase [Christensenellales bacterium]
MITLHARTRSQFYEGHADWKAIARLKQRVSIPVVGNGDILCWQDALRMREETGCDGVAVGRAAQGNPWIFAQIRAALAGEKAAAPDAHARVETALGHARALCEWKGERVAVREMRKHAAWYVRGLRGAAQARTRINTAGTLEALERALRDVEAAQEETG